MVAGDCLVAALFVALQVCTNTNAVSFGCELQHLTQSQGSRGLSQAARQSVLHCARSLTTGRWCRLLVHPRCSLLAGRHSRQAATGGSGT